MNIKDKLLEIVGVENFSDDPEVLKKYSKDFSLVPPGTPNYVVKPKDAQEVQKIIQFANEHLIPVVPLVLRCTLTELPFQGKEESS